MSELLVPKGMIVLPGRRDPVPEMWGDKRPVYFCNHCEPKPEIDPSREVAVISRHDACIWEALVKASLGIFK